METFVIRIYGRDERDPDVLIGTVEGPDGGEGEVFTSPDELIAIIRAGGMGKHPWDGNRMDGPRPRLDS